MKVMGGIAVGGVACISTGLITSTFAAPVGIAIGTVGVALVATATAGAVVGVVGKGFYMLSKKARGLLFGKKKKKNLYVTPYEKNEALIQQMKYDKKKKKHKKARREPGIAYPPQGYYPRTRSSSKGLR